MISPGRHNIPTIARVGLFFCVIVAAGCTPSIGDSCEANVDCDTDHVCDLSQTGGYCTISPCPRAGCPGGSVCVKFDEMSSWCMQSCGVFDYCRKDYICLTGFVDADGAEVQAFCSQAAGAGNDVPPVDNMEYDAIAAE